ncbi:hypothetical protein TSOC_002986 [Tetrabaena socialis]|uniref:phytol kinase n=1 Tax=Tetrabaena socialis TaxID=47790 RepID=A0A2J8ACL5_9CHLO|nr:hypothetical protein TSOC_002986 [Tetrabaena socialis]|eukprot:PNH10259.1 hypothetical protein TSOC_002986 [Tetrabaena socialis]
MDRLQCLAHQFAAAVAPAGALTALHVGYAPYLCLLNGLLYILPPADELLHVSMLGELAEALRDSCVMEHWARFVVLQFQGLAAVGPACMSFMFAYERIAVVWTRRTRETRQDLAVQVALGKVLSSRCIRHVMLAHGVAALCAADGGPSYGLPEELLQVISGHTEEAPAGPYSMLQLRDPFLGALVGVLAFAAPSSPRDGRATVLLLLRLARLALASGNLWVAHEQHQQAGLPMLVHAGAPRVVVSRKAAAGTPFLVLCHAWRQLLERLGTDAPAWAVEAGVECWRLVTAALDRSVLRWACPSQLRSCCSRLLGGVVPPLLADEPLPPAPPPAVAAVLAGGLLPCLERLLRRTGEEPDGPESAAVEALLRQERPWRLWAHLLEYGEPRQAAALVATLGKLLRRANSNPALPARAETFSTQTCTTVLMGPLLPECGLAQAQGRQLALLLVYAVCAWLPALSDLVLEAKAGQAAPGSESFEAQLIPLLYWLPLLAYRCWGADGALASAGPSTAAATADAGGPNAADGAGGWRRLLLEEVRVVQVLAAALRLAQPSHTGFDRATCRALARSCCAVAAAFPDEVLRAACSSAWPSELLHALLPELHVDGMGELADGVEVLATFVEGGGSNGGGSGGGSRGVEARERLLAVGAKAEGDYRELAAALVPPAEARAALRTCSYHGCTSLAGDSEADARMWWCRFCNSSCYCCGECQLSHWREGGHKEACLGGAKARPG